MFKLPTGDVLVRMQPAHSKTELDTFKRYVATTFSDTQADIVVMQLLRQHVINARDVQDILWEWEEPSHAWGEKTAYRIFAACSFIFDMQIPGAPVSVLHKIIENVIDNSH